MIQCKRVYEQASPDDGYRVLVDRLWPRGVKKRTSPMTNGVKHSRHRTHYVRSIIAKLLILRLSVKPIRKNWRSIRTRKASCGAGTKADSHPPLWREKHGTESRPGFSRLATPFVIS
jgi:hypothetical protein